MSDINHLDKELLDGYMENLGPDIVKQMIDLYVQQSEIYLQDINEAIKEQSQSAWQESCHKMKGATASVGLVILHGQLVVLEKSEAQWSEKVQSVKELEELNQSAIADFTHWLSSSH